MKKLMVVAGLVFGLAWTAQAQEAVGNNPSHAWTVTKTVVDVLSPQVETLYDFHHGEWFQGVSASLWNINSESIPLASIRAGYAVDKKVYGGLKLDLPGISRRYVPATIKGIATQGYLDAGWKLVGKYAAVGGFYGYDFERSQQVLGVSLGGTIAF